MTVDAAAILRAVRERLTAELGVAVRRPDEGDYEPGVHEAQSDRQRSVRSAIVPRVEARAVGMRPHAASPPWVSDRALVELDVEVAIVRTFALAESVSVTLREELRGAALTDGDVVRQALSWPGSLAATSDATPTGLVSGCLRYESSEVPDISAEPSDRNGTLTTTHTLTGVVRVTQETSP